MREVATHQQFPLWRGSWRCFRPQFQTAKTSCELKQKQRPFRPRTPLPQLPISRPSTAWPLSQNLPGPQPRLNSSKFLGSGLLNEYFEHYNHERPHQSLGGVPPLTMEAANGSGPIESRKRAGGLLCHYARRVA